MKRFYFILSLLISFSIGQMWGADPTISWAFKTLQTTSGTQDGITWETGKTGSATATVCNSSNGLVLYGVSSGGGYFQTTSAISGTITNVNVVSTAKKNTPKYTVYCSADGSNWTEIASDQFAGTKDHAVTGSYTYVKLANTTAATAQLAVTSITVTYTPSGGTPTPSVSADPEEVANVPAAGVDDQTIDLTYENITDYETEVSVHPNADGTGTLSPAWLTASISDADDYATITYSVSANTGDARTAYIKVYTTDGDAEAETIIPVSQVKYSVPTGTFELFSGDLVEGDYVIYYNGKALQASVTSDRWGCLNVTPSENKFTNPDASIVWHIAASDDNWTLYNAEEEKYAASTGAKNKGALIEDGTDDKAIWSVSGTYDFINVARSTGTDPNNKYLRYNSQNADNTSWACYASGTGGALTLYKKQIAGQPATPSFSVAGGSYEETQTIEISCETTDATIYYTLDGTAPTNESFVYSTALNISSTTTVKAIAIKNDVASTVASATYTIIVWQTVAEVWNSITADGPKNAHIYGYVSQTNVSGYANNFYISDNGSTEGNQLYAFRMDMNSNSVEVGDKVKLAGDLTIYNDVKEFKYTDAENCGKIIALEAKGALQSVAISGTPTKTTYAANEDFDPAGLIVSGTYANGYVAEITEGITWGNDLTDGKVTASTTVHVTATVSGKTSSAYNVAVTVASKTLSSIAVGTASYTIFTGEELPKPAVMATYSEGNPEDVSELAVYDSESVFNTATIDNPNPQTITVSYTFGGVTKTTTYTVSVKDYANADNAPYTVAEALEIITNVIGNTESAREIVVTGIVSVENINNNKNRYKISDGTNELLVYAGKGFNSADFTDANYPKVNDVVKVKGKVINYNNNTPEFVSGKSYLLSQVRPATIAIEDVASFEVGATDLTESDLDITTSSAGAITFVSGDETKATIVSNAIHAVAQGSVTITANLAATENVDELNYAAASTTFNVTVVAPTTKYAITFDGNGADGGSAPDAIADKAAGAEVTLPTNSYTKTGKVFDGWKVINNTTTEEVTITAGAFTMPASAVTIQAQWTKISSWAEVYTSNIMLSTEGGTNASLAKVRLTTEGTQYDALKAGTSSVAGALAVTVPAGATKLHFHAYGWKGESVILSITASNGVTVDPTAINLTANTGVTSNSPFTLAENSAPQTDAYFCVSLSDNSGGTVLLFNPTMGKRFVLFGVNQEGAAVPASITADPTALAFGSVDQGAEVEAKTINVTLTEVAAATVALSGDGASAFSIDKMALTESGTITVTPNTTTAGQYAATITISDNASAVDPVEVAVSMTVTEPAAADNLSGTWVQVTDASQLVAGKQVIIASIPDEGAAVTMSTNQAANNRTGANGATVSDGVISAPNGTAVFTIVAGTGENTIAFKSSADQYLYAASSSKNYLRSQDTNDANGSWIVEIEDGVARITAQGENTRNVMRFNPNNDSPIFACYSTETGTLVTLFIKQSDPEPEEPVYNFEDVRTGLEIGRHYTACLTKKIVAVRGATIWGLSQRDYAGNTAYLVEEVLPLPAGAPFIYQATDEKFEVAYEGDAVGAPIERGGLRGTFSYMDAAALAAAGSNLYMMYANAFHPLGTNNHLDAYRAYLLYNELESVGEAPQAPGRRVKGMPMQGNVATGIDNAEATTTPKKVLIDGQLFIQRGEMLYDATGRLVK